MQPENTAKKGPRCEFHWLDRPFLLLECMVDFQILVFVNICSVPRLLGIGKRVQTC